MADVGGVKVARRLVGAAEVEARLRSLEQSARNKLLRPGVAKATRLVTKAAKALAPVGPTGQTKRAMTGKVVTSRKRGVIGLVGALSGMDVTVPFKGRAYKHDPSKILHIVERGRKAVEAKPGKVLAIRGRGDVKVRAVRAEAIRKRRGRLRALRERGSEYVSGGFAMGFARRARAAAGKGFLAAAWAQTRSQAAGAVWDEVRARLAAWAA